MSPSQIEKRDENGPAGIDWGECVERALHGDRLAYGRLARLVTGYLARWRAYDFRADWDDIVQEVLVSTVAAHREARLPNDAAFQAFVRQATRFKFIDRIRTLERQGGDHDAEQALERPGVESVEAWPPSRSIRTASIELRIAVGRAVEQLSERERAAVVEVHLNGRTYDEAAAATGIPLGSLKRALKTGLAALREVLDESPD